MFSIFLTLLLCASASSRTITLNSRVLAPSNVPLDDFFKGTDLQQVYLLLPNPLSDSWLDGLATFQVRKRHRPTFSFD